MLLSFQTQTLKEQLRLFFIAAYIADILINLVPSSETDTTTNQILELINTELKAGMAFIAATYETAVDKMTQQQREQVFVTLNAMGNDLFVTDDSFISQPVWQKKLNQLVLKIGFKNTTECVENLIIKLTELAKTKMNELPALASDFNTKAIEEMLQNRLVTNNSQQNNLVIDTDLTWGKNAAGYLANLNQLLSQLKEIQKFVTSNQPLRIQVSQISELAEQIIEIYNQLCYLPPANPTLTTISPTLPEVHSGPTSASAAALASATSNVTTASASPIGFGLARPPSPSHGITITGGNTNKPQSGNSTTPRPSLGN